MHQAFRIPNNPLKFFSEYFREASAMSLTEHIHDEYVHNRRMRVLSDHLAKIIPQDFHMLDVGCCGGLLARLITQKRSDLDVRGSTSWCETVFTSR
jgi:2-polyprenyl-3-methyl-5-hydroxy-6-metoxy-1,4-benzoquinol methylase